MRDLLLQIFTIFITFYLSFAFNEPEQCAVYCSGDLLNDIQLAYFNPDSKYFVDMPMKYDPSYVVQTFNNLPNRSHDVLEKFLTDNFLDSGSELITWKPNDWNPSPAFLDGITDPVYRQFAKNINGMWTFLGKQLIPDVAVHPQRYSMIPQANPFIVPGERFHEFYYWDSYWIIKGLLVCGMNQTAKGIIINALNLVTEFGFVPNGARVYYLTRSQPPFLSEMVRLYYEETKDLNLVIQAVSILEKEYHYWMSTHYITDLKLNHYTSTNDKPRPESYRQDYNNSQGMTEDQKREYFANVVAAAESGEDFSTRWFTSGSSLQSINTRSFVPVDLNSILYRYESNMLYFYNLLGINPPTDYAQAMTQRKQAMDRYLWNSTACQWYDYYIGNQSQIIRSYPSNFYPVWAGAYDNSQKDQVLSALMNSSLVQAGGVLSTKLESGQQWDSPNAWAPHQSLMVQTLIHLNTTASLVLAQKVALQWISATFIGYNHSHFMHEKYNAFIPGQPGVGGEYPPQVGFGWTNGVTLEFLRLYGNVVTYQRK